MLLPMNNNPLLQGLTSPLPLFADIQPEHVHPAMDEVLSRHRQTIDALVQLSSPNWDNLLLPLSVMDEELARIWGPVTHLNSVCDSAELRPVYQEGVAKMSAWHTELAQNEALYDVIKRFASSQAYSELRQDQRRVVDDMLRDFRLSGAELEGEARHRFKEIRLRLSELATSFEQHVLDATRAFTLHASDAADLVGLPESVVAGAAQRAKAEGKDGWLFTLDIPSYLPFMQYSERRDLREKMYTAYCTRASVGELDNTPVIEELLKLRREMAALLGFDDYAEYSLATKMASGKDEVTGFLRELAAKSKPLAEKEMDELRAYARTELALDELAAWDIPFISERLRQHKYAISQEELKPYFPEAQVLQGLFRTVEGLYGIRIQQADAPVWHEHVRYYDILDAQGARIAGFYFDLYARAHKRGGAWMDECLTRWRKADGELQLPVAYLICNFDAPVGEKPALWTHDEVITLFHEFGHGLHHMMTRIESRGVSGINGVPWDAVELPSQFMENFCWERDALDGLARHYQSGEALPDALYDKMMAAKNFLSGMQMLRQIEFSLFDFLLHSEFVPGGEQSVQGLLDAVRQEVAVVVPPAFNKFQNSFSHIFAGGYAAGYYSYKWAEVLSADAFAAFEEEGVNNKATAQRFLDELLSVGGSRDIMEAFVAFRGRKPTVDALLRHSGVPA